MMSSWKYAAAAASLALMAGPAIAQDWPSRPVTLVVPYPAGGNTDTLARLVAAPLSDALGQPVIVENMPGAAGTIGSVHASQAEADGYTILFGTSSTMAGVRDLHGETPPYAPDDFSGVTMLALVPLVLTVSNSFEVSNIQELLDYARNHPGELNYGSDGVGGLTHLAGEVFQERAGIEMQHIPYQGTAPMMTDILSGAIDLAFAGALAPIQYMNDGQLKIVAVGTSERISALPDVPTLQEAGVEGYDVGSWFGIVAPAGTDAAILDRLSTEIAAIIAQPEVSERIAGFGFEPMTTTPAELDARIRDDFQVWDTALREAGLL
ncbi:hypothetical protein C4N9_00165 [Pararhodobacter marinus]|uniref:Tripartite tricarboxylate transporter substrate binding protein n=2 Tax=Pararhodobacter marinus TaxID=2184063 RepID=A0A2U2CI25_9RHOB|nr:hypothetical protein C4N9_00165 [Pararhodobacter marinus]